MTVLIDKPMLRLKAPGDPLDRLVGLALASVEQATGRLANGGTVARWRRDMEQAIATAHQAAFITATAERLGVPPDSPLISRARLSRAEREDIKRAVQGQLQYLDGFAQAVQTGELTPGAIQARANMYARAIRATYEQARIALPLPAWPGDGTTECLTNCKCTWRVEWLDRAKRDADCYWVMGAAEHCPTCQARADRWAPLRVRGGKVVNRP